MKLQAKLFEQLQQFLDVELMDDGNYYVFNILGDKVHITVPVLAMLAIEIRDKLEGEIK